MAFRYVGMVPTKVEKDAKLLRMTTQIFGVDLIHEKPQRYTVETAFRINTEIGDSQNPVNGFFKVTEDYDGRAERYIELIEGNGLKKISLRGGLEAHFHVVDKLSRGRDVDSKEVSAMLK